jgi:hypothetical protein
MTQSEKANEATAPSVAVIKQLFAKSGNKCAFKSCVSPIVDEKKVVGKICHIKAKSEGWARYDPHQTAAERHGYDNLILLCGRHHDVIDDDPDAYTVDYLHKMKLRHEESATTLSGEQVGQAVQTILDQSISAIGQSGGITAHIVNIHFNESTQTAASNTTNRSNDLSPNLLFTGVIVAPVSELSPQVWSRGMGRFEKQWATENGQVALVAKFTNEARKGFQNISGPVRAQLIYRCDGREVRRIGGCWLEATTDLAEFRVDQTQELIIAVVISDEPHTIFKRRVSAEFYGDRIESELERMPQSMAETVVVRLTSGDTGEVLLEREFKFSVKPMTLAEVPEQGEASEPALPDSATTSILSNVKFIRIKRSELVFPQHKAPSFARGSGVEGIVAYFRNDAISGIVVPPFRSAKAHTRFFDRTGVELVSVDAAPWLSSGTDTSTLDVGITVGIILAISADGNKHYARNTLKVPDGFSWSPGETFGFSDTPIPIEAERVEIVLIDEEGRATDPFAFAIIEDWLFDPV